MPLGHLGGAFDRFGKARLVELRQSHEARAAARRDRFRRIVGAKEPALVVVVEGHEQGQPPRQVRHGRSASHAWLWTARAAGAASPATSPPRRRRGRRMPASWCPIPSNRALPEGIYGTMTLRSQILRLLQQEDLNFLLTNRIPRRLLTQFMGWFSQIEQPLVRDAVDRAVALLLRPRPERSEEIALSQHARLLHPRAQGRCTPDRPQPRHSRQPVRCDRRRVRRHRRHHGLSDQGVSLHAWRICSASTTWSMRIATADMPPCG